MRKSSDIENLLFATLPGGIEAQEKMGQTEFVRDEVLPKKMLYGCTKEILEKMGIVFGEDHDDIFINCTLPEGWQKIPTDHSMWSDLVDEKGRKRAAIFYKAAFYDRNSHIMLIKRFNYGYEPEDRYKNDELSPEERSSGNWFGMVFDCGNIIYKTDPIKNPTYKQRSALSDAARRWLIEKYPNWDDPLAYWD